MGLVSDASPSNVSGDLNIVSVTAQQSNEAGINAVVVDIQPHMPSRARSSVESGRGLPLYAGSFIPLASLRVSSLLLSSRNSAGSFAQSFIASLSAPGAT